MKKLNLQNWNFFRVLRLVAGIAILVQAILARDILFGIAGLWFTAMPLFNIGCCATGNCSTGTKKLTEPEKEISYEEVV
jgi:hypothetical protein